MSGEEELVAGSAAPFVVSQSFAPPLCHSN